MMDIKTGIVYTILLFCVVTTSCSNKERTEVSMFDSKGDIYSLFMQHTPLGSYSFEVLDFINNELVHEGIMPPSYEESSGLRVRYPGETSIYKTFGVKSIKVHIGDFPEPEFFFLTKKRIFIQLAFDENDELVLINIHKNTMK